MPNFLQPLHARLCVPNIITRFASVHKGVRIFIRMKMEDGRCKEGKIICYSSKLVPRSRLLGHTYGIKYQC